MSYLVPVSHPAAAFRPEGTPSLADVRACVETHLSGSERRDVLSAFSVLAARLKLDLADTPASAPGVRRLFEINGPAALGVTPRRHANIRSLVARAVRRFGLRRAPMTRTPLSPAWAALLESAHPHVSRQGLSRLARYCSAMGVAPEEVGRETLLGLFEALEAESLVKKPRRTVAETIGRWNTFRRRIPGWPPVALSSPWKVEPDVLPLARFPESFQADVAAWVERATRPRRLDLDAPRRALRPATIENYVETFRRFASALVRGGLMPLEEITALAVFFHDEARFVAALERFLPAVEDGGEDPDAEPESPGAFRMARQLSHVARHYVRIDPELQKRIDLIVRRLDPKRPRAMGRRSRDRLEQFDEPQNVRRLLRFPGAEAGRALRLAHPRRRAWGMECALAAALLIDTSLRLKNLRLIKHETALRRVAGRVHLTVRASEVKNRQELVFELSDETAALLERFLEDHRPHLPGHEGPYLFPGETGGPKSDDAMRAKLAGALRKRCGLVMTPHLFRHATAKILVEKDPAMYAAVSRHLGHRSMTTTMAFYLGGETPAASRKLGEMLRAARDEPHGEED